MSKNPKLAARGGPGTMLPNSRQGALGHAAREVEPDAHGNRAQRRAWERLYGSAEALADEPPGGGVGTTEDRLDE